MPGSDVPKGTCMRFANVFFERLKMLPYRRSSPWIQHSWSLNLENGCRSPCRYRCNRAMLRMTPTVFDGHFSPHIPTDQHVLAGLSQMLRYRADPPCTLCAPVLAERCSSSLVSRVAVPPGTLHQRVGLALYICGNMLFDYLRHVHDIAVLARAD